MVDAKKPEFPFLAPRMTPYIAHAPTPKQRAFMMLPHREAFFAGAAGGGKSDALLMCALQYVDVPGYHALIIRKTLVDSKKPGSLLFRAREWLGSTDAVWRADEHTWYFPSGATLTFGKLGSVGDAATYQGADYQFIGVDEATQLHGDDVDYVCNTRLRKPACPHHPDKMEKNCQSCLEFGPVSMVPLRIRMASNPGGIGHSWVKKRYRIDAHPTLKGPNGKVLYVGQHPERPHIPAFLQDNPYLDQKAYLESLSQIEDPVTRQQMVDGDWGVSTEGRFKVDWIKRFKQTDEYFTCGGDVKHRKDLLTFMMIDAAASRQQSPGKIPITKRNASYTAITVWSIMGPNLLLRYVYRHQQEVPSTRHAIHRLLTHYSPISFVGMELTTMSTHLFQMLKNEGLPMRGFSPNTGDKIARSVDASNRMEQGLIWFPEAAAQWLREFEEEIFTWTGHPAETDDQVDCLSYAAQYATKYTWSRVKRVVHADDLPSVER